MIRGKVVGWWIAPSDADAIIDGNGQSDFPTDEQKVPVRRLPKPAPSLDDTLRRLALLQSLPADYRALIAKSRSRRTQAPIRQRRGILRPDAKSRLAGPDRRRYDPDRANLDPIFAEIVAAEVAGNSGRNPLMGFRR